MSKRVLLLEPDKSLGQVIKKYLNGKGFEVITSSTSQDAISKADLKKPDLVVLELAVPLNNGVEFIQEFQSYADWINIPLIVYSHIPLEDTGFTQQDWLRHGVRHYLYKPTSDLAKLSRVVGGLI